MASVQFCVLLAACCLIGLVGTAGADVTSTLVTTIQPSGGSFESSEGLLGEIPSSGSSGLLSSLIADFQRETEEDQKQLDLGRKGRGGEDKSECPCNGDMPPPAADSETKNGSTCMNRKMRGECDAQYMIDNEYCACTCDRCDK